MLNFPVRQMTDCMNHVEGLGWREDEKTQSDDFVIDSVVVRMSLILYSLMSPEHVHTDCYLQVK